MLNKKLSDLTIMDMATVIFVAQVAGFAIMAALNLFTDTDNSDVNRSNRSGMSIYTDNLTGVQYLGKSGTLTPRLNADGTVVVVTNHK